LQTLVLALPVPAEETAAATPADTKSDESKVSELSVVNMRVMNNTHNTY
jgi:hypothetical protein